MKKWDLKGIAIVLLAVVVLAYYIYFGIIKCQHNLFTDWIGTMIGISCGLY